MYADDYNRLLSWADDMERVFTLSDLRVLYCNQCDANIYKKIRSYIDAKKIIKIKRGLYALPDATLSTISARIDPDAYISTATVLARNMMIGSVPEYRIQAIKVGPPRTYTCALGVIEHLSIAPHLFFGFEFTDGLRFATPEKAWLDVCYFAYKGRIFSFDPDTDVNREMLDRTRLQSYLQKYEPRFRDSYNKLWSDE